MSAYSSTATTPPSPSRIHAGGTADETFVDNLSRTINQAHLQKCRQGFSNVYLVHMPTVEQGSNNFNVLKFFAPVPSTMASRVRVSGVVLADSTYTSQVEIELSFYITGEATTTYQTMNNKATIYMVPGSNPVGRFDHTISVGGTGLFRPPTQEFVEILMHMKMSAANANDKAKLSQISVNFEQQNLSTMEPYQNKIENTSGAKVYTGYPLGLQRGQTDQALSSAQAWTWKQSTSAIRKMPLCIASMSALRDRPSIALSHLVGDDKNRLSPYPHIHFCRVPITDKDIVIKAYAEILNGPYHTNKIRMAVFDIGSLLANDGSSPDSYEKHPSFAEGEATIPYENSLPLTVETEVRLTMPAPTYTIPSIPTCRFIAVGLAVSSSLYRERFGFSPGQIARPRICSYGIWCSIDD